MIQFYPVSARRLVLTCFAIAAAPECRARRPPRTGQRHLEGPAAPGRLPQDQLPRNPTATGPWQDGSGRAARLCSAVAGVSLVFCCCWRFIGLTGLKLSWLRGCFLLLLAYHWFGRMEVVVLRGCFLLALAFYWVSAMGIPTESKRA